MSQTPPQPPPFVNYATPGAAPPKKARGLFGWVLFIGLAVMLFLVLQTKRTNAVDVPLSAFLDQLSAGNVKEVIIDGDTLRGFVSPPRQIGNAAGVSRIRAELPPTTSQSWAFIQWLNDHSQGATIRVENNQNLLVNLLLPVIPWLLVLAFVWFFILRPFRRGMTQPHQAPPPTPVYIVNPEQK